MRVKKEVFSSKFTWRATFTYNNVIVHCQYTVTHTVAVHYVSVYFFTMPMWQNKVEYCKHFVLAWLTTLLTAKWLSLGHMATGRTTWLFVWIKLEEMMTSANCFQILLTDYMFVCCCWQHSKTDDLARPTRVGLQDIGPDNPRRYGKI